MTKSRIKILRVIARMNIGGPALQITTLMQGLSEEDFHQLLAYGDCESNEVDFLEFNQISLSCIKLKNLGRSISLIQDLSALIALWKLIREFKPDIVHTHTFKAGLLGRMATIPLRKRPLVIHTYHGHLIYGYFGAIKSKIIVLVEKYLASISDMLIAVGEKVRLDLLANGIGNPLKFRVIHPGFALRKIEKIERFELGIDESDFVCCWVGRLTAIKRPYRILELAIELQNRNIGDIKFLIIGDGELKKEIEREAISKSLPIIFLGWRIDSVNYIDISNILILTSENEGTPISIIEAQKLGKAVISTEVGSVDEVMIPDESGYLLDYDINIFCDKILYLKNNPLILAKYQSTARVFANTKFSKEKFIHKYTKLYKELISS